MFWRRRTPKDLAAEIEAYLKLETDQRGLTSPQPA